jgi:hypothetical protein
MCNEMTPLWQGRIITASITPGPFHARVVVA